MNPEEISAELAAIPQVKNIILSTKDGVPLASIQEPNPEDAAATVTFIGQLGHQMGDHFNLGQFDYALVVEENQHQLVLDRMNCFVGLILSLNIPYSRIKAATESIFERIKEENK